MTQEAFKAWWYNQGSQAPYTHHDYEEHTMRMCEIAWNEAVAAERKAIKQIIRETSFSNWFQADLIEAIDKRGQE